MRHLSAAILWSGVLCAQTLVPPAGVPAAAARLEARNGETELRCSVEHARPLLDFGLPFRSIYRVALPLNQSSGLGRTGEIALRVTPEDGAPAYFLSRFEMGSTPRKTDDDALMSGEFFTGEGRYLVQFALSDDSGRVCRKQWRIEARREKEERHLKLALLPNSIADGPAARAATRRLGGAAPRRITVLMNASEPASVMPLLESLLRRFTRTTIRFTAFVLGHAGGRPSWSGMGRGRGPAPQEPRELFHRDRLTPRDLNELARAIDPLAHWAVDYHDLLNENDRWDLLAGLIHREVGAQPADALLFLGVAQGGAGGATPAHFLERESAAGPRVFYLQYVGFPEAPSQDVARWPALWLTRRGRRPTFGADSIQTAVARLHGKTFRFDSPAGFAKAIESIGQTGPR